MIKADSKNWARRIFNPYEEYLLKRNFSGFNLTGNLPEIKGSRSLIITPNHFSWWDGFFIDYVLRKLFNKNFHILMLEEQLKKYSFFRKVGAFSINPDTITGIKESLDYASHIIANPKNLLIFYPQGSIEPFDKKPLTVKRGLLHMINGNINADILPAAFRIEYNNLKKPTVFFRFGNLLSSEEIKSYPQKFEDYFNSNLKELNQNVINKCQSRDLFGNGNK